MTRAGFRVHGRVQGVGFRWWTRTQAVRLGLAGSVRNLPDGAVEIFVQGHDTAVQELREQLASGPTGARVERVETVAAPPIESTDFRIER